MLSYRCLRELGRELPSNAFLVLDLVLVSSLESFMVSWFPNFRGIEIHISIQTQSFGSLVFGAVLFDFDYLFFI